MIVAAAVCPHPPLIVPELAGEAAAELDELRAACAGAVRELADAGPLIVVGGAPQPGAEPSWSYPGDAAGSFAPWGLDLRVGAGDPVLPLSLTVGRWLAEQAGAGPVAGFHAISFDASPGACAELGVRLAAGGPAALLVMADGSARLTEKSPGYLDPRAQPYDREVAGALDRADLGALAALDPGEAASLWFGGRAALQVLAGAWAGGPARTRLHYSAPYGVGYFVSSWTCPDGDPDELSPGKGE